MKHGPCSAGSEDNRKVARRRRQGALRFATCCCGTPWRWNGSS